MTNLAAAKPSNVSAWKALPFIALACIGMWGFAFYRHPVGVWLVAILALAIVFVIAGHSVTGRRLGVLIDDRNVMSLSRFQMAAWTWLILSAFLAAAWIRIVEGIPDALSIALDGRLWALMGISTMSLVASPLILSEKKDKAVSELQVKEIETKLKVQGVEAGEVTNQGQLYANRKIESAAWSDMITGEGVDNAAHLDLARLQMLFFTVVTLLAFAADLFHYFLAVAPKDMGKLFPSLHESMVTLIGISHAGYLTAKAAPRNPPTAASSPSGPAATPTPAPYASPVPTFGPTPIPTPTP